MRWRVGSAFVALAMAASLLVGGGSAHAVVLSGANGPIVYTTPDDLRTINPDGTGEQILIGSAPGDDNPAWAPNGQFVAFDNDGAIFIANPDGTGRQQLTTMSDYARPSVSPMSDRIVFDDANATSPLGLFMILAAGGILPLLLFGSAGGDLNPVFSPDGQFILFLVLAVGLFRLFADGTGGRTGPLLGTEGADFGSLRVSPDGFWIYFALFLAGIFRVPYPDGGARMHVSGTGSGDFNPVPSPDGTRILFTSEPEQRLYTVPAPGGGPREPIPTTTDATTGHWSRIVLATPPPETPPPPPVTVTVEGQTFVERRGREIARGGASVCAGPVCVTSDRRSGQYSLRIDAPNTIVATSRRGAQCMADSPTGPPEITVTVEAVNDPPVVDWYCPRR